jgi:hypothetical protein
MNNIIQIKRRLNTGGALPGAPASLSGGEIAFNEVDKVLYYGYDGGTANGNGNPGSVIGIAGPGLYVDRSTDQTVGGVKTFTSTVSALGNVEVDGTVDANTFSINSVQIVDSSRNATFNDITADGNVVVTGNLTVQGDVTTLNTDTYQTSAFNITNEGSTTALIVNQTGTTDIAEFQDDGVTALVIKGGATNPGYVGIGTSDPNEKLTVVGNVSATGVIYGSSLEVGSGSSTLYVDSNKVGINTEAPNEELTVVGSISATEDLYARNGSFAGTLDVTQATTLNSTLYVSQASTFASAVSAASTLTVDGTTTLNDDLTVVDLVTVKTSNYSAGIAGKAVIADATNGKLTVENGDNSYQVDYTSDGIDSAANTNGFTITTAADGGAGIKFTPAIGSNTNVTQGNLVGNTTNKIEDFIIDGGTF